MQWQITSMIISGQLNIGGVIRLYQTQPTNRSRILAHFHHKTTLKNAMMQSIMHGIMSLERSINTAFTHLHATYHHVMQLLQGSRTVLYVEELQAMIHASRKMLKSIIIDLMYNKQCMQITRGFHISGLLAGWLISLLEFMEFATNSIFLDGLINVIWLLKILVYDCLCSDELLLNWKDSEFSMLSTYRKLIAAGYRIWMFRYIYNI